MATALAVNTYDNVKFYLSTRDNGAPGAGVWSVDSVIADSTPLPGIFNGCSMGGAAAAAAVPAGMLSQVTGTGVYYLGVGSPATPVLITTPTTIAANFRLRDYWNVEDGVWTFGGAKWALLDNHDNAAVGFVSMVRSTDGGATWVVVDDAHAPAHSFHTAARWDGGHLVDVASFDSGGSNLTVKTFDFTANGGLGGWSASDSATASTTTSTFDIGNEIIRFSNGDIGVFYNFTGAYTAVKYRLLSGGVWGAEINIVGSMGNSFGYANSILDPAGNLTHLFYYVGRGGNGNLAGNGAPIYGKVTQAGTPTLAIFTFPVYTQSDGVGHGKIGSSRILVPYDNTGNTETSNDIWVATLGGTTFSKETIPKPPEQQAQITLASLNPSGTGYVVNDTGTVNGGLGGFLATYKVLAVQTNAIASILLESIHAGSGYAVNDTGTVNGGSISAAYQVTAVVNGAISTLSGFAGGSGYAVGDTGTINGGSTLAKYKVDAVDGSGAVTSLEITDSGAGYSVANNIATTRGGSQPGIGSGLTVNISAVANGRVSALALTNLGGGYSVANNVATTPTSGVGSGLQIDILSLFNGVSSLQLTYSGRGYSVANNVATTPGGAQPGVGSGLTINILSVAGITPCCAYIPTELSSTPLTLACPVTNTFTVGTPFNATVVASGGATPYTFALIGGLLPPGLTLNTSTGVISGTPTTGGTYNYTVQVTDALGQTAVVTCSLTQSGLTPPSPSQGCPVPNFAMLGVATTISPVVTNGVAPFTFAIISGALPPGLTLDPNSGVISGVPTVVGNYSFSIQVTDSSNPPKITTANCCSIEIIGPATCPVPSRPN